MSAPKALCTWQATFLNMCGWFTNASFCRWLMSEHLQKANLPVGLEESTIRALPQEKQVEGSQHLAWLYRIARSHPALIHFQEEARDGE